MILKETERHLQCSGARTHTRAHTQTAVEADRGFSTKNKLLVEPLKFKEKRRTLIMSRMAFSGITVLAILLISTLTLAFNIQTVKATYGTIHIRADGSIDPPTAPIQRDGNLYTFTADIYDSIVVERDNIIIDGAGYTLQGTGRGSGIRLYRRTNVTVRNTQINNFDYGVWLLYSSNNSISGNNIANNNCGVYLDYSSNSILGGNNITNNGSGVSLRCSFNNIINGNTFTNGGLVVWDSYQNVVENNTVNGKPLVYLEGVVDYSVGDAGQVILVNCDGIRVENLNLSYTSIGVQLWETKNSVISGNNITNNNIGVVLYSSSNNSISGNNITNNSLTGVRLEDSSNNSISGNNITANYFTGVQLDNSSNNSISGNKIKNNGYGIYFYCSSDNGISENNIKNNEYGILLSKCSNSTLKGNILADNKYNFGVDGGEFSDFIHDIDISNTVNGKPIYYWINKQDAKVPSDAGYIALINCTRITAQNLNLTNNWSGVLLFNTTNSTITGNNITANYLIGVGLWYSSNNSITGNNITNNSQGIVLSFSSNNSITVNNITNNRENGVYLDNSSNNNICGNNITNNSRTGVQLDNSSNNSITVNNITNNRENGVYLDNSSNNSITGNNITANYLIGVGLWYSSNNSISGNNIANNWCGVGFGYSSNNWFYHNNFIDNSVQVYSDGSVNMWDDGYPSAGNYWSNYKGVDYYSGPCQNKTGSDGIGDASYVINENNVDHYPLMGSFKSFNISLGYPVNVISNSTVEDFRYFNYNSTIVLQVSNRTGSQTTGFCRLTIPHNVVAPPYTVKVNSTTIDYQTIYENQTEGISIIYFTYKHSTLEIVIVPEFPSTIILSLIMVLIAFATIMAKRRLRKHYIQIK